MWYVYSEIDTVGLLDVARRTYTEVVDDIAGQHMYNIVNCVHLDTIGDLNEWPSYIVCITMVTGCLVEHQNHHIKFPVIFSHYTIHPIWYQGWKNFVFHVLSLNFVNIYGKYFCKVFTKTTIHITKPVYSALCIKVTFVFQ